MRWLIVGKTRFENIHLIFSVLLTIIFWAPSALKFSSDIVQGTSGVDGLSFFLQLYSSHPKFSFVFLILLGISVSFFFITPLLMPIAIVVLIISLTIVDLFVFKPMAWLLEKKEVENWIRVISLFLLLIGFHFDFLAS